MKKLGLFLVAGLLMTTAIVLYRTFSLSSKQLAVDPAEHVSIRNSAAPILGAAIRIPTISSETIDSIRMNRLNRIHALIDSAYPLVRVKLTKEVVSGGSLLYTWEGRQPDKKPILLTAHLDVVPVDTLGEAWEQPAFDGVIDQEFIHGRGSLDDKVGVFGILEGVEYLLQSDYRPDRTVMLAFGHDEETGGAEGAAKIAALLKSRNIHPEYVLDEGLVITDGIVPGLQEPAALIGTSEKGYLSVKLSVSLNGGHSSMPEKETAITALSAAVLRIQHTLAESRIPEPMLGFIEKIGPEMGFVNRMAFANLWLFEGLVIKQLEKQASGNASIRTTAVTTVFHSGVKDNVVPAQAEAIVNIRLLPGDESGKVIEDMRRIIADERVVIEPVGEIQDASPISPSEGIGYEGIEKSIREIFPEAHVAPSLMIGGTDGKHYTAICPNVYRFLPVTMNSADLKRVHGNNERIAIQDYHRAINFYVRLIRNTCGQ